MDYRDVITYLITPESAPRKIVNEILLTLGFRQIITGQTFADVKKAIEDNRGDIIILGAQFDDGDIHELVKSVRSGRFGPNPFLPFLTFVNNPTKKMVNDVSNSGSDDLISYPMSPNTLAERIAALVENRKPFVVTADYIGPDRRHSTKRREGTMDIPLIDAPNTLRTRVKKDVTYDELQKAIIKAKGTIQSQRVDRSVDQVAWLVARILAGYFWADGATLEPEIVEFVEKLTVMAHELEFQLKGKENKNIAKLCGPLHVVSARLQVHGANAEKQDLKLLDLVSTAFKYTLENKQDDKFVKQINALIES
jgi:DNA-binding response OmpR family regulator